MKREEERNAEEILQIVFGYGAKISKERRLDSLLMLMADMGRELTLADRCALWIYDKFENKLWTKVAHGVEMLSMSMDSGFVAYAVKNCEALIIEDAYLDGRFNKEIDNTTGYRTKSVLVIPIVDQYGQVMGAYQAINKTTKEGVFTKKDMEYLKLASSYAEKVIESALLYEEIDQTQKNLIVLLGKISESRCWETGCHIYRVAEYSKLLATKYGLSEEEIDLLYSASPMHDIGKIALEDNILKKPGSLTQEEYDIVKTHAKIGNDLLKASERKLFKAAAIIAYEHHEKWNGTGYPRGLKGEEIHIFGRITAVADVFDALSHERCYKKAMDRDTVINIIMQEKGQHFDPKLVDVFMDNLEELYYIQNCYGE